MRALTFKELDGVVAEAQKNIGQIVTDLIYSDNHLILGFRESGTWMIFAVDKSSPVFFLSHSNPLTLKKQIKPIYLFLKKHLIGKKLKQLERRQGYGRVVDAVFESSSIDPETENAFSLVLTIEMLPHGGNILAKTPYARLSLHKPKEIVSIEEKEVLGPARSPDEIRTEWLQAQIDRSSQKSIKKEKTTEDVIVKKEKILRSLEEKMQEIQSVDYQKFAEWLAMHRSLEVPMHWESLVDQKRTLQENIEWAYERFKKNRAKLEALKQKQEEILLEIQNQPKKVVVTKLKEVSSSKTTLLKNAKGRTKDWGDGVRAYIGKSAEDNLKLLRNARPWHLWIHARDFPGSHGILSFNKNQIPSDQVIKKTALWVLQQTVSEKVYVDWRGLKCQFVICECRYVTPIRGDRKGQVTYKNERTLTVIVD